MQIPGSRRDLEGPKSLWGEVTSGGRLFVVNGSWKAKQPGVGMKLDKYVMEIKSFKMCNALCCW